MYEFAKVHVAKQKTPYIVKCSIRNYTPGVQSNKTSLHAVLVYVSSVVYLECE